MRREEIAGWLALIRDGSCAGRPMERATIDRAIAALGQPCAAPGEEWEPVARILVDERVDWVRRRMEEIAKEFKPGDQMGIVRRRAPAREGGGR